MMKANVLLLETVSSSSFDFLNRQCNVFASETPYSVLEISKVHDIHGIITRGKGNVDKTLINSCNGLRVITRCGVGLDNIDLEHANEKNIAVLNAPGINAYTVAEHTMSLILNLQRKLWQSFVSVKAGNWLYRNTYDGDEIRGKTLGILGFGNIGQKVAKLASAFEMEVWFWDRKEMESPFHQMPLDHIFSHADVISIHLPLTEDTRTLLSGSRLQQLEKKPLLVNTARAEILADSDILEALKKEWISGFAADMLEVGIPPVGYELLQMENVIVTPHSASLTKTTYDEMCMISAQNTIDHLSGKTIDDKYFYNKNQLKTI